LPGWNYSPESSYWEALAAGFLNTLKVSATSLIFAAVLGFAIAIARLYAIAEVRWLAQQYVTLVRSLPVLLQLVIWYTLIVGFLPPVQEGLRMFQAGVSPQGDELFGLHLNNRGLFLAYPSLFEGATWIFPQPTFGGRNLSGGFHLTPEYLALFLGLGFYTASFIAEIVRGGILSVDRGQSEAARALGLSPFQTLRLVVMPQAWKVILPPLTSQCLGLVKNSSLAVAVGYPDLVAVGGTILNQTGRSIEVILIWMSVYLTISLLISLLMNRTTKRNKAPLAQGAL
jgi:general L-amino acid transport system permease protein